MNFLIIADNLRTLKTKTDSSLGMANEALKRNHTVHWATHEDIVFWEGRLSIRADELVECPEGSLPSTKMLPELQPINSYDGVWIRKDPPFDSNYLALCWLLASEENNVPMINKPSVLLRYHEKMIPWEAKEKGYLREEELIPTFLSTGRRIHLPKEFPKGESVIKPWLGHGGKDVTVIPSPHCPEPYFFLQPLQKEIEKSGDRRIFILNGDVIGSFVRLPPPGEIKSNIASGGTGILKDMNKKEIDIANRLGEFLKEAGIAFAGVDMIHEKVSEVNITSPTGLLTYRQIGGPNLIPQIINFAEELL